MRVVRASKAVRGFTVRDGETVHVWVEREHPRDPEGQFSEGGGGGGASGGTKAAQKEPSFDHQDRKAIEEYNGVNFQYANSIARGRKSQLGQRQQALGESLKARLDTVFQKVPPLQEATTLYRGVWGAGMNLGLDVSDPSKLVGKTIEDGGWTSTSTDETVARTFAHNGAKVKSYEGGAIFKINVPPGSKVLNVEKHSSHSNARKEKERLLDRGGSFKITGFHKSGGVLILETDYVPRTD